VKSLQADLKLSTSQLHDFQNRLELLQSQIRSSSPSVSVLTLCVPSTILRFFSIIPRPLLKGRCFSDSCMKVVIYSDSGDQFVQKTCWRGLLFLEGFFFVV
jgi:hypothetical protein